MLRDTLFLLQPDFIDPALPGALYFCGDCAPVEGILAYYPALTELLEIRRIAFAVPRQSLVDLLGASHQGCPVLVMAAHHNEPPPEGARSADTGRCFVAGVAPIAAYLARVHGIGRVHPSSPRKPQGTSTAV